MKLCSMITIASMALTAQAFAPTKFGGQRQLSSPPNMVAVDTSDIKTGMTVELEGEPYKILSFSIMKQGRAVAKTTIKYKNLIRGTTLEETYISGKKLQTATIDRKAGQYTYADENGNYYFMDNETFEEVMVDAKVMEDSKKWILDGMQCTLVLFKGNIIEVITPNPFVYEVIETEPNMKGNTASGGFTKPAKLSCGATISIPGFVDQGSKVKVDTEKGEYMGRE